LAVKICEKEGTESKTNGEKGGKVGAQGGKKSDPQCTTDKGTTLENQNSRGYSAYKGKDLLINGGGKSAKGNPPA